MIEIDRGNGWQAAKNASARLDEPNYYIVTMPVVGVRTLDVTDGWRFRIDGEESRRVVTKTLTGAQPNMTAEIHVLVGPEPEGV